MHEALKSIGGGGGGGGGDAAGSKSKKAQESSETSVDLSSLAKAIRLLEEAAKFDAAKRTQEALKCYTAGIEGCLANKAKIKSPQVQTLLAERVEQILTRAEVLKKWLKSKEMTVSDAARDAVAAAVSLAEQSERDERAGDIAGALIALDDAMRHFERALQLETNKNTLVLLRERSTALATRGEVMRRELKTGSSAPLAAIPLNNKSSP